MQVLALILSIISVVVSTWAVIKIAVVENEFQEMLKIILEALEEKERKTIGRKVNEKLR